MQWSGALLLPDVRIGPRFQQQHDDVGESGSCRLGLTCGMQNCPASTVAPVEAGTSRNELCDGANLALADRGKQGGEAKLWLWRIQLSAAGYQELNDFTIFAGRAQAQGRRS